MDFVTLWLGVATAAGTVLVQVYAIGKFAQRVDGIEKWTDQTDLVLDKHAEKLENHGHRIAVLEDRR